MKVCLESNQKLAEMGLPNLRMVKRFGWWEVEDVTFGAQKTVQDHCKRKLLGKIQRGQRPVDCLAPDYYPETIFHSLGNGKRVSIPCTSAQEWQAYKIDPVGFYQNFEVKGKSNV